MIRDLSVNHSVSFNFHLMLNADTMRYNMTEMQFMCQHSFNIAYAQKPT